MERLYHSKDWLVEQLADGKTSKDIGKHLNVSYKLVEIYLRKHNIDHVSQA